MAPTVEPEIPYWLRAGNQPKPLTWGLRETARRAVGRAPLSHTHAQADYLAAAGLLFWADISSYQKVVTSAYPYHALGIRADFGTGTDTHAKANWAFCDKSDRIQVVPAYAVFKKNQSELILKRLKSLFGSECPPKVLPEVDMESGDGFAGPGNHSAEANDFIAALMHWANADTKRPVGYANGSDWGTNWPSRYGWMHRRLAAYSSNPTPAGYFARQYYGALKYPVPAGYPTSCKPFGSYVDMNVFTTTGNLNTLLDDTGLDYLSLMDAATLNKALATLRTEIKADTAAAVSAATPTIAGAVWSHAQELWNGSKPSAWTLLGNVHEVVHSVLSAVVPAPKPAPTATPEEPHE